MLSSVSGTVFHDLSGDGKRDPEDPPIAGLAILLMQPGEDDSMNTGDDLVVSRLLTDPAGRYQFSLPDNTEYFVQLGDREQIHRWVEVQSTAELSASVFNTRGQSNLLAGGPLGRDVEVSAALNVATVKTADLRQLDDALQLSRSHGNYLANSYGRGEKWLKGASPSGGEWYFVLPGGDLYHWDRTRGVASGEFVAFVGVGTYNDPRRLHDPLPELETLSQDLPELAYELDSRLHFQAAVQWHQNYGGLNVRWFTGVPNVHGNPWYFVTQSGDVKAWDKTPFKATGTTIATFDASHYTDPVLLTNPLRPTAAADQASLIREAFGIHSQINPPAAVPSPAAKWFKGEKTQFGLPFYFVDTSGRFFAWNGLASETGRELAQLGESVHANPAELTQASFFIDTADPGVAAYDLDRLYDLVPRVNFFFNWSGQSEKWIEARTGAGQRRWLVAFPNGEVHQVESWNNADRTIVTTLLAALPANYYSNPLLLTTAVQPLFDTVRPSLSLNTPQSLSSRTNITITGQVDDNRVNPLRVQVQTDANTPQPLTIDANGDFTFTTALAINGSADGQHTIRFLATDELGNVSNLATVRFTLDTTAQRPTLDLSAGSDSGTPGDGITNAARVTLTGRTEPNATVSLTGTSRTALSTPAGTFQFENVSLALGDNSFTVTVTDAAGNQASHSQSFERLEETVQADVAMRWNQAALNAIAGTATVPPVASRSLAILHIAMLDVLNAFEGTPGFYVGQTAPGGASLDAAIAGAADQVLRHLYPNQTAAFDAVLATSLANVPDGSAKTDGLAFGRQIGDAILAIRKSDGWDAFGEHYSGTAAGVWQATAPMYDVPLLPEWGHVRPFVISTTDEFAPAGPPSLDSAEYAAALNEVKDLGRSNSTSRTADQTDIARFWADGRGTYTPAGHWNTIASAIAAEQRTSLASNIRLFARLNVAMADAGIAAWDVKYDTNFWRPITAIQQADTDGNDATIEDPDWTPLLNTPPFPEYVSGHAAFSGAAASVLNAAFGSGTPFMIGSMTPQNLVRGFSSVDAAAVEAARSRIYGGIHYQFSGDDGLAMGRDIGTAVLNVFANSADTQAPSVLFDPLPAVSSANIVLTGRILDNLTGPQSATIQLDGGITASLPLTADGRFSLPTGLRTNGSDDGTHIYRITATDAAGNSTTREFTFTLDTVAPAVTISSLTENAELDDLSRLSGTADPTGSSLVSLTWSFDSGTTIPFSTNTDYSFDTTLDISRLAVGTHSLLVRAVDAAGNASEVTLPVSLPALAKFTVSSHTPSSSAEDVGVTFRPQIFFSRPVDITTLNATNFHATDPAGNVLPARIAPASDGSFAWLFFQNPLPGASTMTMHVDGSTILSAGDHAPLDPDGDETPGGELTWTFSTVSLAGLPGTKLIGTLADPGADLHPGTFDDVRPGPDGVLMTADDVYLNPIEHVKVYIFGLEHQAVFTDAQGRFELTDIPSGHIKVIVDGLTATKAPSGIYYPEMVMDLNIRPAETNTVMATMDVNPIRQQTMTERGVYLPRLQTSLLTSVSTTEPTLIGVNSMTAPDLTPDELQHLTLTVQPGSILGLDGQPLANPQIGISTVPPELVQGMLPPGLREQHTFEITIQAPGASVFTTPIAITFPNFQNAPPGTQVNIFSFDHTTGLVIPDGTGTVSEDGLVVISDPGSGIRAPGWHFVQVGTNAAGKPCEDLCLVVGGQLGNIIPVHFPDSLLPKDSEGRIAGSRDWTFTPGSGGLFFDTLGNVITNEWQLDASRTVYFLPDILEPSTSTNDLGLAADGSGTFSAMLLDAKGNPTNRATGSLKVGVKQGWQGNVATNLSGLTNPQLIAHVQQRLRYLGYRGTSGDLISMRGELDNHTHHAIKLFNFIVSGEFGAGKRVWEDTPILLTRAAQTWINAPIAPRWRSIPKGGTNWKTTDTTKTFNFATDWALLFVEGAAHAGAGLIKVNQMSVASGGPAGDHKEHIAGLDFDIDTPSSQDGAPPFYRVYDSSSGKKIIAARTDDDPFGNRHVVVRVGNDFEARTAVFANGKVIAEPGQVLHDNAWINPEILAGIRNLITNEENSSYNVDKVLKQMRAFEGIILPGEVEVRRILYNDPRTWSNANGTTGLVQFKAGHGGHFHVDIAPPRPAPARVTSSPTSVLSVGRTEPGSVSNSRGFGIDPRLFYRVQLSNGFAVSGRSLPAESLRALLTPNVSYTLTVYQASTNLSGVYHGLTNASGAVTDLGHIILDQFGGADADGDGLPDVGETAIGTSPFLADTDKDGISDSAELEQGLDPLDERGFPTGVIASLPLNGNAQEVVVEGTTAYVATGPSGLAIVDVSRFNKPILLSQLPLPGNATDVAVDRRLNLAVVATSAGTFIVDIATATAPKLLRSVTGEARRVEVFEGIAYVSSGNQLHGIDILIGDVIRTAIATGVITDIARERNTLFTMDAGNKLTAFQAIAGFLEARSSLQLAHGGGRLFVANGVAYVAAVSTDQGGYLTADVSNSDDIKLLSGIDAPETSVPGMSIVTNGSGIGLLAGQSLRESGDPAGVHLVNVADPQNTYNLLLTIPLSGIPSSVFVASGIAFFANGSGLQVVNYLPFDSLGVAPTVSITSLIADKDPALPGVQIDEGTTAPIQVNIVDDVQVQRVELLVNGVVTETDVSFPWDFAAIALNTDPNANTVTAQVRVTDTGGNVSLSNLLELDLVPDTFGPSLISVSPQHQSSLLELRQSVLVRFNEPIDPATVTSSTLALTNHLAATFAPLDIQMRENNTIVALTYPPLLAGQYTLTMAAVEILDRAGNPFGTTAIVKEFTLTRRAALSTTVPDADSAAPGLQSFEGTAIPLAVEIVPGEDVTQVEFFMNGQSIGMDIQAPFDFRVRAPNITPERGSLEFVAQARDSRGRVTFSNSVTASLLEDVVPPTIVSMNPANGARIHHSKRIFTIQFSEPLKGHLLTPAMFTLRDSTGKTFNPVSIATQNEDQLIELTFEKLSVENYELRIEAPQIEDRAGNLLGTIAITTTFIVAPVIQWIGPESGFWDDPANWDANAVPLPDDDVVIDAPEAVTVTYRSGDVTLTSLQTNNTLYLSGGTLAVKTPVAPAKPIIMAGGTLKKTRIEGEGLKTGAFMAGKLDEVVLAAPFDVLNEQLSYGPLGHQIRIENGLVLQTGMTLHPGAQLLIRGSQTISQAGFITMRSFDFGIESSSIVPDPEFDPYGSSTILTIGAGVFVTGAGRIFGLKGIVNHGWIEGIHEIQVGTFENYGGYSPSSDSRMESDLKNTLFRQLAGYTAFFGTLRANRMVIAGGHFRGSGSYYGTLSITSEGGPFFPSSTGELSSAGRIDVYGTLEMFGNWSVLLSNPFATNDVAVHGEVSCFGTVKVEFLPGFEPSAGMAIPFLTYDTFVGDLMVQSPDVVFEVFHENNMALLRPLL